MFRTAARYLLIIFFTVVAIAPVLGQTLTIHDFQTGIYTRGSTIAVPFTIGASANCIQQDNKFNLYLADALGNIVAPGTPIGTTIGFYGTFVNGVIPGGTAPGTYTLVIKSTDPIITSAPSPVFTVSAGTAVTAGITGSPVLATSPTVFGTCNGTAGNQFFFNDGSSTNASVATFFNESSQSIEGAPVVMTPGPPSGFTAQATNYTIMVTATNLGTIGTQAYTLLNNVLNNSFSVSNSSTICLPATGGATLSYNVDITSANGIQNNYPGTTYEVTWGDGTSSSYTLCNIKDLGGTIMHNYTTGSCGHTANAQNTNSFQVNIQPQSPYCVRAVSSITTYAKVLQIPINSIAPVATGCVNTAITFTNASNPGQDPSSTSSTCSFNPLARYNWSVDGGPVLLAGVPLSTNFTHTFTTNGNHTVTVALQAGSTGICTSPPNSITICIQNKPQPIFTLPTPVCLSTPVTPTENSVLDLTCTPATAYTYLWTVTGPTGAPAVTFAGGTTKNSHAPQFVFHQSGAYTVTLAISGSSCGTATSAPQTINVDATPVVTLSPDFSVCGTNQTFNFSPATGSSTHTNITGTAQPLANTYTWTVSGGPFTFTGGTNANTQYPQINFSGFAVYTVSATEQNSCGTSAPVSQHITFQSAPTVTVTPSATNICPGTSVSVMGNINPAVFNSFQWIGGGGFFSAPNSLTTSYTPTAAEITAGRATITLDVKTSLTGPCSDIQKSVTINIYPIDNITSVNAEQICTSSPVAYTITSSVPGSTYTWIAALTQGSATGFSNGGGPGINTINDVLNNTASNDAIVTYTITPVDPNGCTGTPFTFNVTVNQAYTVTATPVNNTICSGSSANITLTPNLPGTTYTWTSTVLSGNITGNTQQSAATSTSKINDVLINNGTTAGTVQYTLTPINGSCQGAVTSVTITIQPLPTASNPGINDEVCNATSYPLHGNPPSAGTGLWTVTPAAGVTFDDATNPTATATGLSPGTTYAFTWTITAPGGCQSSSNSITVKDDAPSVGGTTNGSTAICSGNNGGTITLTGNVGTVLRWESSTDGGVNWSTITNTGTSQAYVNLTQTTQYRAVVMNGACTFDNSSVTTITVSPPPTIANAGINNELCNATSYPLAGNPPTSGTGLWTVSPAAGITFDDATNPNATASGLQPGTTYQFTWTISTVSPCSPSTSTVTIKDDVPSVGGTTAGANTFCAGNNNGNVFLSGQTGAVVHWESSIDGGANWAIIANTNATQSYFNLTQTTQYRALVQSGPCTSAYSSATVIAVNPPPTAANAGPNDEVCNTSTYVLQGNTPTSGTGLWTLASGQAGVTFDNAANPNATASGLVAGNTYQFTWTISTAAPCSPNSNTVTIKDDLPAVGGTTAGANTFCAGSNSGNVTLSGQTGAVVRWESSTDGGNTWQNIANTNTLQQYSNLIQTTQYRALVKNGPCTSDYSSITIITVNQPPTAANAGQNTEVCATTSYVLQGNTPASGTGLWTLVSGQTGVTFDNAANPNATASGLVPGTTYQFTWAISTAAPCPPSTSTVTITDDLATVGGNTAGANTVCSGDNGGTITLSGQLGRILRWEISTDNGVTWQNIGATAANVSYLNLTQTTRYRAQIQNGVCNVMPSTETIIQVNQPAPVANAGPNQNLCNASVATLNGNNPGTFPGLWTQTGGQPATITNPASYQTTVAGLLGGNVYTFTWTISALAPCATTQSQVTIINNNDVIASFTTIPKSGCGNLAVQFTNTSNNQAGATFLWNFGDGSASSNTVSPRHTFAQRTDGRDTTYYISLNVIGNCAQRAPVIDSVLVRPATPIARILPNSLSGCGAFALDVQNISPGNNITYDFYLYDGSTLVQKITKTDKSDALFNAISTASRKTFTLYMIATGYCNNTGESIHIPITISPLTIIGQMFIQDNVNNGCAPLNVTFINNSSGGDTFHYNIYDSNNKIVDQPIGGTDPLPYIFKNAGTYYVTITASNSCGSSESSPRLRIDVYQAPTPNFSADVTQACKDALVNFTNTTTSNDLNTPVTSLIYDWNFGDGSTHSFAYTPPAHSYHFTNSPYTVTLTATNTATGCSSITIKQSYIVINGPPATDFIEKPDSITSIPNYTFSFIDQTKGSPVSWKWTFSDGQTSTRQNPIITFPDTGLYKATLTTTNALGCDSTITHSVRITGVPGQLYLPNAFIPSSATAELRVFMAKGSGIKIWLLQIFNKYGQVVWQTSKLDSKGAPVEGWDGTFNGLPVPQGVYVWQASATFINGNEWKGMSYNGSLPKRVGSVHLIR